ncbi:hypothetical protein G7046_g1688 [Stylonectria norvegica]|nr:hypothetical protein G7046_g1688 [Stylonectria norvegica]
MLASGKSTHENTCGDMTKPYCKHCGDFFVQANLRQRHEEKPHTKCLVCSKKILTAQLVHHRRNCAERWEKTLWKGSWTTTEHTNARVLPDASAERNGSLLGSSLFPNCNQNHDHLDDASTVSISGDRNIDEADDNDASNDSMGDRMIVDAPDNDDDDDNDINGSLDSPCDRTIGDGSDDCHDDVASPKYGISHTPRDGFSAPSNVPTTASQTILSEEYLPSARDAVNRGLECVDAVIDASEIGQRGYEDGKEMREILESMGLGRPIAADDAPTAIDGPTDQFILEASTKKLRKLLERGPPCIPILQPGAHDGMSVSTALAAVESRGDADLHDFASITTHAAITMNGRDAVTLFEERRRGAGLPVNCLSIKQIKENPTPEIIANLRAYQAISAVGNGNDKSRARKSHDLEDSQVFQLLATKNAHHLPHIDRHGVITTVCNEDGDKLWLCWVGLTLEQLAFCGRSRFAEWPAEVKERGMAIHIPRGWTLIQPSGTLHAPLTLQDCFMTGTMHWNSLSIPRILALTKLELMTPSLTNEDLSPQFVPEMSGLLGAWKKGKEYLPWPPIETLAVASEILKVSPMPVI